MSKSEEMVSIEINGRKIKAFKNETILYAARRNGIYIPTMCHLTKVKPIASCRLCVVDIDGLDTPVLSCQERVVEGIKVKTDSQELFRHRQNIMKLYDLNHPLQCGVCPKTGECDLQNKTVEFQVSTQHFSVKEQKRELEDWGNIIYDPYLCIMCERCVRVSNEIIGDGALKVSAGGYNSKIINTQKESPNVDWGECAAVCPVGALSDKHFKCTTNPWELTRVPASSIHSSFASPIYYEIKNGSFYRVRNESEFDSISGVSRYGYDFENSGSNSDEDLQRAVDVFRDSDTISFTSLITNEEALILQNLKKLHGYKLINKEALDYQKFLKAFASTSGKMLYSGRSEDILNSDFITVFGSRVSNDIPELKFKINQASKNSRAEVIYLHPIEDSSIQNIVTQFMKYEVGSEDAVLVLLAKAILKEVELPEEIKSYFKDIDEGYLSAESNIGEEEIELIVKKLATKKRPSFIAGVDLFAHPNSENIAKVLGIIEKYSDFNLLIVPPSVNTLGVSLICDLDQKAGKKVIGYNQSGDFVLSSIKGAGDIDMPALNQQEGTFTNIDKRVVPTHVGLSFDGFCLNDIANKLGLDSKYTIDYTAKLPKSRGFKSIEFDNLDSYFDDSGKEVRGYELGNRSVETKSSLSHIEDIESFDGLIVYSCNPNSQKNIFTNLCKNLPKNSELVGSNQFSIAAKIKDKDLVNVTVGNREFKREFRVDSNLKGTVALLPTFDMGFDGQSFSSEYRFSKAKVVQVEK